MILTATTVLFFGASSAQAAILFNVSAGVPLSNAYTDTANVESDGVSGVLLHASLPMLPGLGLENYETKLVDTTGRTGAVVKTTMYDLFFTLPIPFVNLTGGVGVGSLDASCALTCTAEKGAAAQWYLQAGLSILVFDIHARMHTITGKAKFNGVEQDLASSLLSVGVSAGF